MLNICYKYYEYSSLYLPHVCYTVYFYTATTLQVACRTTRTPCSRKGPQ